MALTTSHLTMERGPLATCFRRRQGDYRFYLSGDDSAQFAVSTDASPNNRRVIASVPASTSPGDFFVYPSEQSSELIRLSKGSTLLFRAAPQGARQLRSPYRVLGG